MANTKITSRVLADNAVLTANITDANVTTAKVADNAVTGDKVADDVALAGNPTTTTQSAGNNTTRIATTEFVSTAVADLADSAPDALNTLNELAAAMGDDANFSTTITNSIAAKLPLAGGTMTGDLILGDNVKVEIGSASGGDLQLYHDGSNSYISDAGTGYLVIMTDSGIRLNTSAAEVMLDATPNGAVTLYHNNAAKLATTSTGVSSTGYVISNNTALFDDHSTLSAYSDTNGVYLNGKNAGWLSTSADGTQRTYARFFGQSSSVGEFIQFNVADATRMKIDSSGSVGINVTPSTDWGGNSVLQMSHGSFHSSSSFGAGVSTNLAATSSGWAAKHIATGAASLYLQATSDGGHRFYTVASASAGASATITERMRINGDGNVGIGDTNPADKLEVNGLSAYPHIRITSSSNTSRYMRIGMEDSTTHVIEANGSDTELHFKTAGLKRMEILTDGYTSVNNDGAVLSGRAGLHVEHGGLLINGTVANGTDAIGSSDHHSNYWTFVGSGGRSGSRDSSFRIEVPDNDNSSTNNGYGGFSVEIYLSGYQGVFCHAMVSGYNNSGITISEAAILRSGGSHSLSYGVISGGTQGFYVDIDIPSYTHSSAYYRITKGGDTSSNHDTDFRNLKAIFT